MNATAPLVVGSAAALITAIYTAIKVVNRLGVEKVDVKITTADKVMIGQDRFIEALEESVRRTQDEVNSLRQEVGALRGDLQIVTNERDALRAENIDLRARVAHLEQRVEDLSHESRAERRKREDAEPRDRDEDIQ